MMINSDGSLSNFKKSYLYNLGFGYRFDDNIGISTSYLRGSYMGNESKIVNLSLDRIVKVGRINILQYAEIAYAKVRYPNYYNQNNELKVNNRTNGFAIFCGLKILMMLFLLLSIHVAMSGVKYCDRYINHIIL